MVATNLNAVMREIENKFKEAIADEEKAVPFYYSLKKDIEITISLLGTKEKPQQNALFSMLMVVEGILRDETRHRESIKKLLPTIQQMLSTVSLSVPSLNMQQVTIGEITYHRDDAMEEFRVVGHPDQRISFQDYEEKYFGERRWLRAHFSGNITTIQTSRAEAYETTNQENAVHALEFWILNGMLLPGLAPEKEQKRPGRGQGKWLDIEKAYGKFNLADFSQRLSTDNPQKAVGAVKSWVYGGQLK